MYETDRDRMIDEAESIIQHDCWCYFPVCQEVASQDNREDYPISAGYPPICPTIWNSCGSP